MKNCLFHLVLYFYMTFVDYDILFSFGCKVINKEVKKFTIIGIINELV